MRFFFLKGKICANVFPTFIRTPFIAFHLQCSFHTRQRTSKCRKQCKSGRRKARKSQMKKFVFWEVDVCELAVVMFANREIKFSVDAFSICFRRSTRDAEGEGRERAFEGGSVQQQYLWARIIENRIFALQNIPFYAFYKQNCGWGRNAMWILGPEGVSSTKRCAGLCVWWHEVSLRFGEGFLIT